MDAASEEKRPLYTHPSSLESEQESAPPSRREYLFRRPIPVILLLLILWTLFRSAFVIRNHYCPHKGLERQSAFSSSPLSSIGENLIPLEAHIMSKCPDAKDCLELLVVPTMAIISNKVNFTLSYIGTVDAKSDEVSCMHGPGECLGNIIQLCAAEKYPDPKQYLGFTNCMTSDYKNIPERDLVEECALEYGIDFDKLNACISDEGEGIDLLRASVERSRDVGVTKSCTVRLDDKIRCIRDAGTWSDCAGGSEVSDLVSDIEDLYKKRN